MAPLVQLFGGGGRGGCSVRRRSNSFESAGGTTEPPASAPTDRTPAPPARPALRRPHLSFAAADSKLLLRRTRSSPSPLRPQGDPSERSDLAAILKPEEH